MSERRQSESEKVVPFAPAPREPDVNTPPPKGGGFELRLKAGLVRLRRT